MPSSQHGPLADAHEPSRRGEDLLGCLVSLSFCAGLIGLAVSPAFALAVPRWFIFTYGITCSLLALLAPLSSLQPKQLLTFPHQDDGFLKDEGAPAGAAALRRPPVAEHRSFPLDRATGESARKKGHQGLCLDLTR
jgi:hypothetical protein